MDMQTLIGSLDLANKAAVREFILETEKELENLPGVIRESPPLKHSFSPGIYVRELKIPAGILLTGKIHKHEHPNFLVEGEVAVLTEHDGVKRLTAPYSTISPAGTKRLIYTHTDTIWITVHHNPDNLTDLEELEKEIIAEDYAALEE